MKRFVGPLAALAAGVVFIAWGGPIWAERAERATLAPLVALAVAVALMPQLRTRRAGVKIAAIAVLGTALSGIVHYLGTHALGWQLMPAEVAWTALFYTGMLVPVAGVCAITRAAGGPRWLAIGLAVVFGFAYIPGKVMVHRPKRGIDWTPDQVGPSERVELVTSDGYHLRGTFFPAKPPASGLLASAKPAAVSAPRRAPAVIVQHGISAEHSVCFPSYDKLVHELGYAALGFDWRGHGHSDGHVVTFGAREVEDVRAAVAWLKARPDVDPDRIAIVGESLGGAIAIIAASQMPELRGVCADAAYDDLRLIAADRMRFKVLPHFLGRWIAGASLSLGGLETGLDYAQVSPVERIAAISPRPVLLVHGDADDATAPECSQHLFDAAREPRELYWIHGAGHHRRPQEVFAPDYRAHFAKFLEQAFK